MIQMHHSLLHRFHALGLSIRSCHQHHDSRRPYRRRKRQRRTHSRHCEPHCTHYTTNTRKQLFFLVIRYHSDLSMADGCQKAAALHSFLHSRHTFPRTVVLSKGQKLGNTCFDRPQSTVAWPCIVPDVPRPKWRVVSALRQQSAPPTGVAIATTQHHRILTCILAECKIKTSTVVAHLQMLVILNIISNDSVET